LPLWAGVFFFWISVGARMRAGMGFQSPLPHHKKANGKINGHNKALMSAPILSPITLPP